MNLVILGANGRTGTHVLRLALERGETVTAVVRSEEKRPKLQHTRLRVVVGDPCDPAFLADVFRGQDAAISTLGGRMPTKRATAVYPDSADAIIQAAWESGLKRVVVTSTALLFPARRWRDAMLAALVGNVVKSATRMERSLAASNLNVTVARCGFLTDDEHATYRALEDALPVNGSSVSRAALATFLIHTVLRQGSGYRVYGVSSLPKE